MPIPWVDISSDAYTEFQTVRETIKEGIQQCVPDDTRVHENWVYEIDAASMLGRVTAPMRVLTGANAGKVHCWTLGIGSANYVTGINGLPDVIGGHQWTWSLILDVWGLFGYDGLNATQQAAENEARLISAFLFRNAGVITSSVPRVCGVFPLRYPQLNPNPFSDGTQVIVAAGAMEVRVNEAITH